MGRIFAFEIWGTHLWEGIFLGEGSLLLEFYGVTDAGWVSKMFDFSSPTYFHVPNNNSWKI